MELEARSEIIPYSPLILLHDPMHSADNGWPHNALRHHWLMPIGCHFRDCKALLVTSLTHVSGAIPSVIPLPLPLGLPMYATDRQTNRATDGGQCLMSTLLGKHIINDDEDEIFDENVSIPQYS